MPTGPRATCGRARRSWLHIGLLVVSLVSLPIIPDALWKPAGDEDPVLRILGLLAATIGLPYFLLSTTGPLVQAWFARSFPSGTRVSAVRAVELRFVARAARLSAADRAWITDAHAIARLERRLRAVRRAVCSCRRSTACAARADAPARDRRRRAAQPAAPSPRDYVVWLLLAAMGSYMLLAVTNHITQNVASVPFLWILPLILYLVTFILCFEGRGWYQRRFFLGPLAVIVGRHGLGLHAGGDIMDVTDAVPIYLRGAVRNAACSTTASSRT